MFSTGREKGSKHTSLHCPHWTSPVLQKWAGVEGGTRGTRGPRSPTGTWKQQRELTGLSLGRLTRNKDGPSPPLG